LPITSNVGACPYVTYLFRQSWLSSHRARRFAGGHGTKDLVGHLAHEVVGRVNAEHFVEARDTQGQFAADDKGPVALTIPDGEARQKNTYFCTRRDTASRSLCGVVQS